MIFTGKVDSVGICAGKTSTVWLKVKKIYKGETIRRIPVSFDCVTSCRMQFMIGDEWLIYGEWLKYGHLTVEFCSRTRKHADSVNEDYGIAQSGITYSEEITFLDNTYEVKKEEAQLEKEVIEPKLLERNLIKPKGTEVIWLLVISLGVMLAGWLLFKKFWK